MRRIVVVGASLAGLKAVEGLRRAGFAGEVVVVGAEAHAPYDRPPLSKAFLRGETAVDGVTLRQAADLDVRWQLGVRAEAIDATNQAVVLAEGPSIGYDGLVIATGAAPRGLSSVPLMEGVNLLRTVDDALELRMQLRSGRRVVVIGTGFIGTEIASTCCELGLDVALVGALPVLHRPLGPLAYAAASRARSRGVYVKEGVSVTGIVGEDRVQGVCLDDGSTEQADVVVLAVGAAPVTDWLIGSGAKIEDGVVCDATLAVRGLDCAVAAGDVARWPHPALNGALLRMEHWTNATEQGMAAARRLVQGSDAPPFVPVPSFWTDQFGVRIQGVGLPTMADTAEVVEGDAESDWFVAEYRRSGTLVGVIAAGAPKALMSYRVELARNLTSPLAV